MITTEESAKWNHLANSILLFVIRHEKATDKEILTYLVNDGLVGRPSSGILPFIKKTASDFRSRLKESPVRDEKFFLGENNNPIGSNPFMEAFDESDI